MDSLSPSHWFFIIFGLFVAFSIVRRLLNPPRELPWAEVPQDIRQAAESALPGFNPQKCAYCPLQHEYKIDGSYRGDRGRMEIECDRQGAAAEIEYEARSHPIISQKRRCEFSEVPDKVVQDMNELLGEDAGSLQATETKSGRMDHQIIYEMEGRSANWKWEIELTDDGRLLELEKKMLR